MSRYARLSLKMQDIGDAFLAPDESPFSANTVTVESINFPITETCKPTKVCAQTCYAACGPITWPASLRKQTRNHFSCCADPVAFAERVARHRKVDFVTWNGSGDLFPESVQAINHAATIMPDIPIWVRTRIPKMAVEIKPAVNVYVHFSLDRHSLGRRDEVTALGGIRAKHHYSYQYDAGETGPYPEGVKIVFGNNYVMPTGVDGPEVCPLNLAGKINDVCRTCRRCFGG